MRRQTATIISSSLCSCRKRLHHVRVQPPEEPAAGDEIQSPGRRQAQPAEGHGGEESSGGHHVQVPGRGPGRPAGRRGAGEGEGRRSLVTSSHKLPVRVRSSTCGSELPLQTSTECRTDAVCSVCRINGVWKLRVSARKRDNGEEQKMTDAGASVVRGCERTDGLDDLQTDLRASATF